VTLIKCPHCGHTVLSVAAQCPACSGTLGPTFLGLEHDGELTQCRSCGHPVRTRTRVCPHCGLEHPGGRSRVARGIALALLAVALTAIAVAAREQLTSRSSVAAAPASPPARTEPEPITAVPPPAPGRDSVSATPTEMVAPVQTVPRVQTIAPAETVPPAPPEPVAAPPATADGPDLQTRWTAGWSNVRGRPANDAPVLRVLPPGVEVRGRRGDWGWWAVRLGGDTVGYIAGALLVAAPPSSTRPPGP